MEISGRRKSKKNFKKKSMNEIEMENVVYILLGCTHLEIKRK